MAFSEPEEDSYPNELVRKTAQPMTLLNQIWCIWIKKNCADRISLQIAAHVKWTRLVWSEHIASDKLRPHNFSHMQFIIGVLQKFTHNKMCIRIQARKIAAFVVVVFVHSFIYLFAYCLCRQPCVYFWASVFVFIDGNICVPMLWKFGCFQSLSLCGWCQRWTRFFTVSHCRLSDVTQNTYIRIQFGHTHTLSLPLSQLLSMSTVHWIVSFLSFVLNSYFDFCFSFHCNNITCSHCRVNNK